MPQDDQNPTHPDSNSAPRDADSAQQESAPSHPDGDAPDPQHDGRIPDDPPAASAEPPLPEAPVASSDATQHPFLYDEDGNPTQDDAPYPHPAQSSSTLPTSGPMVEPGDTPPQEEGVQAVNPYHVDSPSADDQAYRYDYYEDSYADTSKGLSTTVDAAVPPVAAAGGAGLPPGSSADDEDDDEDGMLRMSFMEHLEELRTRLIRIVAGLLLAFVFAIYFSPDLWRVVQQPAEAALTELGVDPPSLTQITPMEAFNVVYIKLPLIAALFLASPWILLQVWGFIAPGLYKRERKWAAPFVIVSAGLFITGGLFAYFVAFRFGLTFLLGIGRNITITPLVSISEYFDLFM
ncbi:MAG: twin-arginine translocase subunit TatC, partial [Bryobacterales bacterium]|nr:twin-arginine translocase subunit TatC [Bryobacterales bacterium]